nr:hypothetical protein [Salegentibacter agarivorans]
MIKIYQHLTGFFIAFSSGNIGDGYPIDEHHQLGVIQLDPSNGFIVIGQLKSTTFQSLVVQYKAPGLPMQKLDLIARFINKNIDRTILGTMA